jgi:hypothetical protein
LESSERSNLLSFRTALFLSFVPFFAGCGGGSKVLKEPQALETSRPLVSAKNADLTVELDWIIVSNGPGSWAKNGKRPVITAL